MKQILAPVICFLGQLKVKNKLSQAPIYIGGCGRSGTTLLLSILSAHPEVFACPKELNLFENASIKNGQAKTPKFYRLYRTFLSSKLGKKSNRYCEKSPVNIHKLTIIEAKHQKNFRFIQMVRDGRDVILSKHPRNENDYWVSPQRWIDDCSAGMRILTHPNVLTIHYEDLILNFEPTIRKICTFLDIPTAHEILNWHENSRIKQNNAIPGEIKDIFSSSIGKWKQAEHTHRAAELMNMKDARQLLIAYKYID